ncbi:MAG: glucosaminidase domain-containing protein [Clostridia bacterium]|nr:glucosaminidase domain-containing protein [Clostridia bacterium]
MKKSLFLGFLALVLLLFFPYSASAASVWGDVNGDRRFSAADAVMVLQYATGRDVAVTAIADADNDGEVTASDVVLLLRGLIKPTLKVEGFALDFDADTDYYLCSPEDFTACSILKYTGFARCTVQVEQYAGYCPYQKEPYVLGEPLQLGHGRARITVTGTLPDGTQKEYLIALADPNPEGYACIMAQVTENTAMRTIGHPGAKVLARFKKGEKVYYLKTEGSWCRVEQLNTGTVGYIHQSCLQWGWQETEMPASYAESIGKLQAKHPNWHFTFVDVEMTLEEALNRYGADKAHYIDPLNYLTETRIFAMLDVSRCRFEAWTEVGIAAIWNRTSAVSKADAVSYFTAAAQSLNVNPYYLTCRAALESGYGTSKFAKGTVRGYEGYYNFYGIRCYDRNPTVGAAYAKERNWDSLLRSIAEGGNWVKNQYIDQGAVTPYFFRFAGFQQKEYMTDATAPVQEAALLRRAYANSAATVYFVIPVYRS